MVYPGGRALDISIPDDSWRRFKLLDVEEEVFSHAVTLVWTCFLFKGLLRVPGWRPRFGSSGLRLKFIFGGKEGIRELQGNKLFWSRAYRSWITSRILRAKV